MHKSNRSFISTCLAVLCTGTLFFGSANSVMRDMTTMQVVKDMGLGINLGNTFEAACDPTEQPTSNYLNCKAWMDGLETPEKAWQSVTITPEIIRGYKTAGFKTVRVPVAWSHRMEDDALLNGQTNGQYNIRPQLMARVKEVVDMILDENMYVILNIHWDGGWWSKFPTDSAEAMRKYLRIWEQVGNEFKDYDDKLIFASLNEEGGWGSLWESWNPPSDGKTRSYGILNAINQAFVNEIRSQSGNNADRHLQVQGYQTNIDRTIDQMFEMPADSRTGAARLAVSVHYYDPFAFTHITEPVDWGGIINPMTTWGTPQDFAELNGYMDKLKTNFIDNGIPVIIGEYGVASWDATFERERESVRRYTIEVTKAMLERNILPVLWDVQLDTSAASGEHIYYYNRHSASFVDPLFVDGMRELAGLPPLSVAYGNYRNVKSAAARPMVSLRGNVLNVTSPVNSSIDIKVIDVSGKVRAKFKSMGSARFSLNNMPSGRYFVEVKASGKKTVSPVILKR